MNIYHKMLELRNRIDFPLRELFRWKRNYQNITTKAGFFDEYNHLSEPDRTHAIQIEQKLFNAYHLDHVKKTLSSWNYYENIFYLHMMEETFSKLKNNLPSSIRCADVGTSHWFYAQILWSFYSWFGTSVQRSLELDGYEVDAYRVYADLYSRYDHALANIRDLPNVHFFAEEFKPESNAYDVITLFFPFVFINDSLQWGLPITKHKPDQLLDEVWTSVKPGGVLMIVNQGEKELQSQMQICTQVGMHDMCKIKISPLLFKYEYDRYIIAAVK